MSRFAFVRTRLLCGWHTSSDVAGMAGHSAAMGKSTEVCPINGHKPTWMLWWKRETCNLRGESGARETAFLDFRSLHPSSLPLLSQLLSSEFPLCGQSTDVFKLNLLSLPTSPPSLTGDIVLSNRTQLIHCDCQSVVNGFCMHLTLRNELTFVWNITRRILLQAVCSSCC